MAHLTPADLVDLAEGVRADSSVPHLVECETCRRQLSALRAALGAAAEADVPEPSPLFWDQLSARVREAVEAELPAGRAWRDVLRFRPLAWTAAVAAIAVVAALATLRAPDRPPLAPAQTTPSSAVARDAATDVPADDPSLAFVADLTSDLDWDETVAAGFAPAPGAADAEVSRLTDAQRRELQRLIKNEMAHPGA
ncbi:MAG: hypothetical protein ACM3SQ_14655 [Betaproteobacteria bacterium]